MIVSLEKFQYLILRKSGCTETCTLQIDGKSTETKNSVKLLVINIDNKLTFTDKFTIKL